MSSKLPPRAAASIDLGAFVNNLRLAQAHCPAQSLLPVIKANGYGHGLEAVARALLAAVASETPESETAAGGRLRIEGCAVAALSEAQRLRDLAWTLPIVLLPGFSNEQELAESIRLGLDPVIHSPYQLALLRASVSADAAGFSRVWLKANTGMNRLGMSAEQWQQAYATLAAIEGLEVVAMSHLACADELDSNATHEQQRRFDALTAAIGYAGESLGEQAARVQGKSLAASGGILAWPDTHNSIVRPGIMLYGSSPFATRSASQIGLEPVMTLRSRLIAINEVNEGEAIGYGGTYVANAPMRVGVVSIGYGDGYPRSAPSGTPVLVETSAGPQRTTLIGRVSMDMITIDVTGLELGVGAEVVLWGEGLPADEIAQHCGTIAYELFCQVTPRVPREIRQIGETTEPREH